MALPETDFGRYLRAQLYWARHHQWRAGASWAGISMPAYFLWVVRRGVLQVELEGETFQLQAGEAWLHAYAKERVIRVLCDAEWLSLGFVATLYEHIDALAPLAPARWKPAYSTRLENWLEDLAVEDESGKLPNALVCEGLGRAVVGWCWESLEGDFAQFARRQVPPWLGRVLEAMHQAPGKTVEQHIHDSGYSPAQFRRNFHRIMGHAPREYLLNHRLEIARRLLKGNDLPVARVAQQAGFPTPAHFSRLFAQRHGMTPSQYRRLVQQPKI